MADIKAKITGANLSMIYLKEGRMAKFGTFSLEFKCECGKINHPFISYRGKEKTSEDFMCGGCKKKYEMGNPIEISYYLKEKQ